MERLKKKLLKETRENSGSILPFNCAEVTKTRKNMRGSRVYEQNTHVSHHARMCIMHLATENMWFLRKVRKPFSKPFISSGAPWVRKCGKLSIRENLVKT